MKQFFFSVVLLIWGMGSGVLAGVVPGRWEKAETLGQSTPIVVRLKAGDQFEGAFQEISAESLTILEGATRRNFPRESVAEIRTTSGKDSLADGLLLGTAVGALGGLLLGAAVSGASEGEISAGSSLAGGLLMGAGIGAGIGLAADAATKGSTTLYKAK